MQASDAHGSSAMPLQTSNADDCYDGLSSKQSAVGRGSLARRRQKQSAPGLALGKTLEYKKQTLPPRRHGRRRVQEKRQDVVAPDAARVRRFSLVRERPRPN